MGGNGSFISGITNFEDGRTYKTILSIGDNIKILEKFRKPNKEKLKRRKEYYLKVLLKNKKIKNI